MFEDVKITARKYAAWEFVNLDTDGTPLDQHGERMVEVEPGKWQSQFLIDVLAYLERTTGRT